MMMLHRNAGGTMPRKPRSRPAPVTVTVADADVLAVALKIADGDASRLTIVSATRIDVDQRKR